MVIIKNIICNITKFYFPLLSIFPHTFPFQLFLALLIASIFSFPSQVFLGLTPKYFGPKFGYQLSFS